MANSCDLGAQSVEASEKFGTSGGKGGEGGGGERREEKRKERRPPGQIGFQSYFQRRQIFIDIKVNKIKTAIPEPHQCNNLQHIQRKNQAKERINHNVRN